MQAFKKNKLRAPALPSPCLLRRVLASDLVSGLHAPSSFPIPYSTSRWPGPHLSLAGNTCPCGHCH